MGLICPRSFQLQNARGKRVIINHATIRFFSRLSKNSSHRHKSSSTGTNKVTPVSGRLLTFMGPCTVVLLLSTTNKMQRYDMIYLLTAIGLSPGGRSTVHIYTQTIQRTTQQFWKSAGHAPSWLVIPWHLPYNRGKSTEKPQSG